MSTDEYDSSTSEIKSKKLNLTSYLRSLPPDYLTKSSWVSRQNQRISSSSKSIISKNDYVSHTRRNLVPYTESFSSTSSPDIISEPTSELLSRHASNSSVHSHTIIDNAEDVIEIDEQNQIEQIILSICWYHGYLGAALYDAATRQAYVVEDKAEAAPEFWILRTLFREVSPKILLLGGKQDDRLFKVVRELSGAKVERNISRNKTSSNSSGNLGSSDGSNKRKGFHSTSSSASKNSSPISGSRSSSFSDVDTSDVALVIRPALEFKYDLCCKRVLLHPWPGLSKGCSELERESWIRCKINLNSVAAVRALGGLMKFLEQKSHEILVKNSLFCGTPILGLHSFHMDDLVHVDEATVAFLQVFSEDLHPAASKNGKTSASKEGLSLFALLSRTASNLSTHVLRRVMLRPIRNAEILEARYEFLSWALQPANLYTIRQLQSCFKNICNMQLLFSRLQNGQLYIKDWKAFYQSLTSLILITEICSAQDQHIDAFQQVSESNIEELYQVTHLIQRTMDFEQSEREKRFVVKPGLDQDLDDQKRKFSGLEEIMYRVSELELANLPEDIPDCCVMYMPHIGFLLGIQLSEVTAYAATNVTRQGDDSTLNETYNIPGLTFKVVAFDRVLFKSDLCDELDNEFGDLQVEIANRETSIMMQLIEAILLHSQTFINLVAKALYIDVLLAFASVSRDFGWTRPTLNASGNFRAKEGRHPLYEVCNPTFVSNDISGELMDYPVSIITGPNSSGKTAYLKQVGVIAYLAHLGCFVPAEKMSFRPLDAIHSVAMVTPSVTSGLSSFMFDLNMLTIAVHGATNKSLVLIDEFGTSTYEFDGASLLASVIDFWTSQIQHLLSTEDKNPVEVTVCSGRELKTAMMTHRGFTDNSLTKGCPLVFVSTHFYKLHHFLRNQKLVKELCLDTLQDGNRVIHLYQVIEGRTKKSYALQVAQAAGLVPAVIDRAKEVHNELTPSRIPSYCCFLYNAEEIQRCTEIVEEFLSYDFYNVPVSDLVSSFRKYLNVNSSSSFSLGNTSDMDASSIHPDTLGNSSDIDALSIHPDLDYESPRVDVIKHKRLDETNDTDVRMEIEIQESQTFDIHYKPRSVDEETDNQVAKEISIINLYTDSSYD